MDVLVYPYNFMGSFLFFLSILFYLFMKSRSDDESGCNIFVVYFHLCSVLKKLLFFGERSLLKRSTNRVLYCEVLNIFSGGVLYSFPFSVYFMLQSLGSIAFVIFGLFWVFFFFFLLTRDGVLQQEVGLLISYMHTTKLVLELEIFLLPCVYKWGNIIHFQIGLGFEFV